MRIAFWRDMLLGVAVFCLADGLGKPVCAEAPVAEASGPGLRETNLGANAFSVAEPAPRWAENIALPDAAAAQQTALRLSDTQIRVGESASTFVRRALIVKDAASLGSVGTIAIPFVPDYQRVQLHAIRILRDEQTIDQTKSLPIRFLQREMGLEQGLYSGEVTASILVNDLRVGDTLEYLYSLHGRNPVFGAKYADGVSWDSTIPALLRRVVFAYPEGRVIRWRVHGEGHAAALRPGEANDNGLHKLIFEERSTAAVIPEPLTPADHSAFRWLQFSEFADWAELSTWAEGLFQVTHAGGQDFIKVVEGLRALPAQSEQVATALEYVQSEIRYFSIGLGESSHRPAQPSAVLGRRYGDCKDKVLLLVSLLRELQIESHPVLLRAGGGKLLTQSLPSPDMFNHAIVQVILAGQTYFLDPTRLGQHGRLDRMGQTHEGVQALIVGSRSEAPITIASPDPASLVRSELSEFVTIPKFGEPGQLRFRQSWNGAGAEHLRVSQTFVPREQIIRSLVSSMERRYPGAKLAGDPQFEDDRKNNLLTLSVQFEIPEIAIENGGNWYLRFAPMNLMGALPVSAATSRKTPISMPAYPFDAKYSLEAQFPENVSAVRDPTSKTVTGKHFVYNLSQSFRGNAAKVTIELKSAAERIEVDEINEFIRDIKALNESGMTVVVVAKNDIISAVSAASSFGERLRDSIQVSVNKITETMKSGKLTGDDLANAYCSRSFAQSNLEKYEEALQDADQAVKRAPNMSEAYVCRGFALLGKGEFGKSIESYSKAITLGSANYDVYRARGMAKFYLGRLPEAADDFVKASSAADQEGRRYASLWLSWTLLRLNRPLPDELVKQAAAEAQGDWPRPALALLAGALGPEDVLKILESKSGDERTMAAAEGYFYIGQYYAGRGETEKAREYFRKTRELNIVPYVEHQAAGFELGKMSSPPK